MASTIRQAVTVNQQDALKVTAILVMLIDHIGAFWFPDMLWLRAIGRLSLPIWAFFLGLNLYASNQRQLFYWGIAVFCLNALTAAPIMALNILLTFFVTRFALDEITRRGWLETRPNELIAVILIAMIPASFLYEYGALPLLFALAGRAHRLGLPRGAFMLSAFVAYIGIQCTIFAFSPIQIFFVVFGVTAVVYILWVYREGKHASLRLGAITPYTILLTRNSLLFYVFHRALIQMMGLWIYPSRVGSLVFWGS